MDSHIRSVYLTEAVTQCDFALNAIRGLNSVLQRVGPAARAGHRELSQILQQEVFRSIHSFLTHASNVSRLLWPALPPRRKRETDAAYQSRCGSIPRVARGAALRTATGLPTEHVLRSRTLRDHLEHFDERLDEWQASSVRRNYVQDFLGPRGGISGIEEGDMMRWFDPETNHMRFRGEEYDIQSLVAAVEDVRGRCVAAMRSDWRGGAV